MYLTHHDIAIPIAWPDQTARGDEKWMALLKKAGIVHNLNFKVGHAAIVLAERKTGRMMYFDFGRYLCPRGYGRARSAKFDPRLNLNTRAVFNRDNDLENAEELMEELFAKEPATHGGGRLLFSICKNVCFSSGVGFAEQLVAQGPVLYGALAKNNNSCSRFVAQVMVAAMRRGDKRIRKLLYPECIKASPTSNVVNATADHLVYCYYQQQLSAFTMNRRQSLRFQLQLLKDNFTREGAKKMPSDATPGLMEAPLKNAAVPEQAQWLGGIGEGAWFHIEPAGLSLYRIYKFNCSGEKEYQIVVSASQQLHLDRPYAFSFHFTFERYSILQYGECILLTTGYTEAEVEAPPHSSESLLNPAICK